MKDSLSKKLQGRNCGMAAWAAGSWLLAPSFSKNDECHCFGSSFSNLFSSYHQHDNLILYLLLIFFMLGCGYFYSRKNNLHTKIATSLRPLRKAFRKLPWICIHGYNGRGFVLPVESNLTFIVKLVSGSSSESSSLELANIAVHPQTLKFIVTTCNC